MIVFLLILTSKVNQELRVISINFLLIPYIVFFLSLSNEQEAYQYPNEEGEESNVTTFKDNGSIKLEEFVIGYEQNK